MRRAIVVRRVLAGLVLALPWLAFPLVSFSTHPSPLPDSIMTPASYVVRFTNDNPYTPPPVGGDDRNFFPTAQAQNAADALDNANTPSVGNPNGYHAGYLNLSFLTADFDGGERSTQIFDCVPHGGCDVANAPADRINVNAPGNVSATEACIRLVMGHELFHHVQYAYITFPQWTAWGRTAVEGTARLMQDKIYSDLDADAGCITYIGQVNAFLGTPNQNIWNASYSAALFWNYLTEQLGTINAEPTRGSDFIRTFWENAQANNADPNTPETVRETIEDFDVSETLENAFHDFTITNIARELDMSAFADAIKYLYRDESDGTGSTYNNVSRAWSGTVPPQQGPTADSVVSWGAKYYEADLSPDCTGIVGFNSDGDHAAYSLIAVKDTDRAERLFKGRTDAFAKALLQPELDPYTRLIAVVAGLADPANFTYAFGCGQPGLQIVRPDATYQAYVGEHDDPERFLIRLIVTGPAVLGTPTVQGLDPSDFSVFVGPELPPNEAAVLSGAEVQGEYWLVAQAPTKPSNATFDLLVKLGNLTSDTELNAVVYDTRILDEMLVIDRSGSMLSPPSSPKLEAAKNAASLFVDAAGSDDLIGVVSFGGDNTEPNDDASLETLLGLATDAQRLAAGAAIGGISTVPSVLTSIGDGLEKARLEYIVRGSVLGDDWIILLSDGMENEAFFYSDVMPSLVADGVQVHSIALGPQTDQALLQQIATDTGGTYYYVDVGTTAAAAAPVALGGGGAVLAAIGPSAPLANRLADSYAAAFEVANGHDRLWEIQDMVGMGGTNIHMVVVTEAGLEDARWSFNWDDPGEALGVEIIGPSGTLTDGVGGVRIFSSATHVEVHQPLADPGSYEVRASGDSGAPDYIGLLSGKLVEGVNMDLYLAQVPDPDVVSQGGTFAWGVPMPILVSLTDLKGALREAQVSSSILHPDGTVLSLPLFDDGSHNDGNADDGIYGNDYTCTTQASPTGLPDDPSTPPTNGSYNVTVVGSGKSNFEEGYTRIRKGSFQVFEILDPPADRDQDERPDAYEELHECLDPDNDDNLKDPDEDGLTNIEEWRACTDPCNPDTDFGGESDGSEVNRGANPVDPEDDGIPRPLDPEVIDWVPDHFPPPDLAPQRNLIRYPSSPLYQMIRLWRGTSPTNLTPVVDFVPDSTGLYRDDGLTNGVPYYYQLEPLGLSGVVGTRSPMFSGTPSADPFPNVGSIVIEGGAAFTESAIVGLDLPVDEPDVADMMVSNDPTFAGAAWQAYSATLSWTLAPQPSGYALAFVKYRDTSLNVSDVFQDDITVVAAGTLGEITGVGQLVGESDHTAISVQVTNAVVTPAYTDSFGDFTMGNLQPGSYDMELSKFGFVPETVLGVNVVGGASTDIGTIFLPEPERWLLLAAGLVFLLAIGRHRIRA